MPEFNSEAKVYYKIIKKSEIEISEKFLTPTFQNLKLETIQAYAVLAELLKLFELDFFTQKIEKTEFGKPYFKNQKIKFNYSHTKNFVAVAVSTNDVGIDLEETTREISDKLATKYLDGAKTQNARLETWVKKEAYSKLEGLGLPSFSTQKIPKTIAKKIIKTREFYCVIFAKPNQIPSLNPTPKSPKIQPEKITFIAK